MGGTLLKRSALFLYTRHPMLFDILNPLEMPSWDSMLLRTPGASFFHGSAWARVLSESYGYTPLYFSVIDSEKFRALVPVMEVNSFLTGKRGVSLPFTDYCDPLIDEGVEFPDRDGIFNKIVEFGKKRGWKYIELRGGNSLLPVSCSQFPVPSSKNGSSLDPRSSFLAPGPSTGTQHPAPCTQLPAVSGQRSAVSDHSVASSEAHQPNMVQGGALLKAEGRSSSESAHQAQRSPLLPAPSTPPPAPCPFTAYLRHTLDLTRGGEALQAGLRDSTRRNIKKAEREKVEIRVEKTGEAMRAFYRLNCMTRQEHGLPPQPLNFFQKIYDHVISRGLGFIALASHQGRIIAGSVFFHFGGKGIYKYGASDRKFQDLRANNLVMWEAVKWFAEKGFKTFCFGRTEMENEGLRQFKNGWGAEETRIQYFRYDLRQGAFVPGKKKGEPAYTGLFRQTPVPVLNLIGSLFYRHMG